MADERKTSPEPWVHDLPPDDGLEKVMAAWRSLPPDLKKMIVSVVRLTEATKSVRRGNGLRSNA